MKNKENKVLAMIAAVGISFSSQAVLNDGDTIAYFPFDSDYMSIVNTECNPASAITYTQSGGSVAFDSSSLSGGYVIAKGTPRANNVCLIVTQGRVFVDMSQFETGEEMKSATIEFFFKSSSEVNWGCKVALMRATAANVYDNARPYLIYLQRNSGGMIQTRADAVNHNGTDSAGVNYVFFSENASFDGEWHHLAMTISPLYSSANVHTGSTISCYFDYGSAITKSISNPWCGFAADGDSKLYLSIGEASSTVAVDEFRITKGVLSKSRFLIQRDAVPQNGEALLYMNFEGNAGSSAPCAAADQPYVMDNAVLAFSTDVKRSKISTYDGETVLNANNTRCLDATKAMRFKMPYWALWDEALDAATIEFLVKGTSTAANWMSVFKFGHSSEPVPFLVQLNSASPRQFRLRADAWSASNSFETVQCDVPSDKGLFSDEKWHHIAMTAEPDGRGHSTIKFWFDYECVHTATTERHAWRGIDSDSMFMYVGRNDCEVLIDEVRISKGVLQREKFLRYGKAGLILSFR